MSPETRSVYLERNVNASPEQVYFTLTHATTLREFLCQVATLNPKPGGRIYLAWDSGYYAAGEFIRLEENRAVAFTWQGRGEPGPTQVEITIVPHESGVRVQLCHSGFGRGPGWDKRVRESEQGWKEVLENLASVLETGQDRRIVLRPMMGVTGAEFNARIAKEIGVPVSSGVRLGGVVSGLSAQVAGLQKDDVLVELDGAPLSEWGELGPALSRHRAGDQVELIYYRGPERRSIRLTLTPRPLPEIPWSAAELAARLEAKYTEAAARLEALFAGVSEAKASYRPAVGEWSAKEVLAHLIQDERATHNFVTELVSGQESWADGYGGNPPVYIAGMLAAYPTLSDLLAELRRCFQVNVAMAAALPADFIEKRKGSYWRLAYNWLQPTYHLDDHMRQMKASIEAAK